MLYEFIDNPKIYLTIRISRNKFIFASIFYILNHPAEWDKGIRALLPGPMSITMTFDMITAMVFAII